MTIRLADLTAADIAAERARFPRAFSASAGERVRLWLIWSGCTALTVYCLYRFGFLSRDFLHGVSKFGAVVVAQLFHPRASRTCRCS